MISPDTSITIAKMTFNRRLGNHLSLWESIQAMTVMAMMMKDIAQLGGYVSYAHLSKAYLKDYGINI